MALKILRGYMSGIVLGEWWMSSTFCRCFRYWSFCLMDSKA